MISQIFTKCVMRLDKDNKLSAEKRQVSCCLYIRLHSPKMQIYNTQNMIFSFLTLLQCSVSLQHKYGINSNSTIHLLISFYQYKSNILKTKTLLEF